MNSRGFSKREWENFFEFLSKIRPLHIQLVQPYLCMHVMILQRYYVMQLLMQ